MGTEVAAGTSREGGGSGDSARQHGVSRQRVLLPGASQTRGGLKHVPDPAERDREESPGQRMTDGKGKGKRQVRVTQGTDKRLLHHRSQVLAF